MNRRTTRRRRYKTLHIATTFRREQLQHSPYQPLRLINIS